MNYSTPGELIKAADAWTHESYDTENGIGEFCRWEDALFDQMKEGYIEAPGEHELTAYKETTDDPGEQANFWPYEHKPGDTWYREIGRIKVSITVEVKP